MTNVNELKSAIKEILEEKGCLNKIRAEIRENIYKAIETDETPKPKVPEENLIINELIREYMNFMGYYHSSSVFIAESGQSNEPSVDRNFLSKELNIIEDKNSKSIPLLYSILFGLKKEVYDPVDNINMNMQNMNQNMPNNMNQNNNINSGSVPSNIPNNNINNQPKGIVFNN